MMHKVPNRTDVIAQFLRERQGFMNQAPHSLSQSVVEPFNIAGFSRFFAQL
jgi:hypothetical protein